MPVRLAAQARIRPPGESTDLVRVNGAFYIGIKTQQGFELTVFAMGQVSFGGGRASGTNDRTGSRLALQRWISPRFIKESLTSATDWTYPYLQR